jgi:hypothetical protein
MLDRINRYTYVLKSFPFRKLMAKDKKTRQFLNWRSHDPRETGHWTSPLDEYSSERTLRQDSLAKSMKRVSMRLSSFSRTPRECRASKKDLTISGSAIRHQPRLSSSSNKRESYQTHLYSWNTSHSPSGMGNTSFFFTSSATISSLTFSSPPPAGSLRFSPSPAVTRE